MRRLKYHNSWGHCTLRHIGADKLKQPVYTFFNEKDDAQTRCNAEFVDGDLSSQIDINITETF